MRKIKESPATPVIESASNDATKLPKEIATAIESPRLRYALDYAQTLSWAVIPCHWLITIEGENKCSCNNPDCKSAGKHPLTKNGLKDASKDPQVIAAWWDKYPQANIGIVTGEISGIVTIDVDINHAKGKFGDTSLDEIEAKHGKLCDDVQQLTGGGGLHYVFEYPQGVTIKSKAGNVAAHIDTRGDNGYIVVEPSNHISGGNYEWEASSNPFENKLPQMPQWLIDSIKESDKPANLMPVGNGAFYSGSYLACMPESQKADLLDALSVIPMDERDEWFQVGAAIHEMDSGQVGFDMWDKASQKSAKYDAKDCARVWFSYRTDKPELITIRTIFNLAKTKYNWIPKPPQISINYPPTADDPTATAREFLKSIGLNPDEIKFSQATVFDSKAKKSFDTVTLTQDGVTFQHLIDCTGDYREQTRHSGKYTGKVYSTPSLGVNETIYITECPIDALSLAQCGFQATAIYNGSNVPVDYYKSSDAQFIVATNDIKSAYQTIKYFKSLQSEEAGSLPPDVIVALPPEGKTWNDLLQAGELTPETMDVCKWRGRLEMASSAANYFAVWREKHQKDFTLIFPFKGSMYKGFMVDGEQLGADGKPIPVEAAKMILDCTINLLHSVIDDSYTDKQSMEHYIEIKSYREGKGHIRMDATEFVRMDSFKTAMQNHRQLFYGNAQDLTSIARYLFEQKPPKIRALSTIGYDDKSKGFVFPNFMYDVNGQRIEANSDKYFEAAKIKPFMDCSDAVISKLDDINLPEFIAHLYAAYGDKGLLAFGFYISGLFSHDFFNYYTFFPFLSLHGDPHAGKSFVSKLLNRCTFVDTEGQTMSAANTAKGELRKISQKSSLVCALLEGRKDKTRFDFDGILPLYNRHNLYDRATTSQDNRTHGLPLKAPISFVWNHECFTLKAAKERVISLHFAAADNNEITGESWTELNNYSLEQLAGIGHYILTNRKFFESNLINNSKAHAAGLKTCGIKVTRIAENHAIALAGITTLLNCLGVDDSVYTNELKQYTVERAKNKLETANSESHLADYFFESIDGLVTTEGVANQGEFLVVHLPTAMIALQESKNGFNNKADLIAELRRHDRFAGFKSSRMFGSPKHCYYFKFV